MCSPTVFPLPLFPREMWCHPLHSYVCPSVFGFSSRCFWTFLFIPGFERLFMLCVGIAFLRSLCLWVIELLGSVCLWFSSTLGNFWPYSFKYSPHLPPSVLSDSFSVCVTQREVVSQLTDILCSLPIPFSLCVSLYKSSCGCSSCSLIFFFGAVLI